MYKPLNLGEMHTYSLICRQQATEQNYFRWSRFQLQFELAHLKLPLVEGPDQPLRNKLQESSHECIELLPDALVDTILDNSTVRPMGYQPCGNINNEEDPLNVFLLIALCHGNIFSTSLQLDRHKLSELVFSCRECPVYNVRNVILSIKESAHRH